MPAFIRYPFFGCVILALSACGSSGSSRLLEPEAPTMPDETPTQPSASYPGVDYLIEDIQDAIGKFGGNLLQVYKDADDNKYLLTDTNVTSMNVEGVDLPTGVETIPDFANLFAVYQDEDGNEYLLTPANVADMDLTGVDLPTGVDTAPDFADLTKVRDGDGTGATRLSSTPNRLNNLRNLIVGNSNRYLSTGAVLARTDDNGDVMTERPDATCADGEVTGHAKCDFAMDSLREVTTTFTLGPVSSMDENRESFRDFTADREPVMLYREVLMSQVRTTLGEVALLDVYEDSDGNRYLLTSDNVTNMNLTDVELPMGVTMAPAFSDLLAVYEDGDGNEYLLTPDNVDNMNLMDVELPMGVTTAPDFSDLSKVTESQEDDGGKQEYVGYDGILRHSMFFVGVHRFFDDEGMLKHTRFANASLGSIYDDDSNMSGIQNPSVALTGEGVMVGMERQKSTLESHLVQGDVNINYSPFDEGADPADMADDVLAMIDISIDNIQRLANDDDAWYAGSTYAVALTWTDQKVMDSKFSYDQTSTVTATPGTLRGSFYGTKADPEVGGVFHHESPLYEIIGSFGSKLNPMPEDDDDMMDQ